LAGAKAGFLMIIIVRERQAESPDHAALHFLRRAVSGGYPLCHLTAVSSLLQLRIPAGGIA